MSNENNTPLETKIILTHKGEKTTVGIQQTNCDPVFFSVAGGLAAAISRMPELIVEAERRWQTNPRYPKADLPEPPAQAVVASHPVASPATRQSQNSSQTPMF